MTISGIDSAAFQELADLAKGIGQDLTSFCRVMNQSTFILEWGEVLFRNCLNLEFPRISQYT
jgi:hypothetical protein